MVSYKRVDIIYDNGTQLADKCVRKYAGMAGLLNILSPRQNVCHFADDIILKCISLNTNFTEVCSQGPIDNNPAWV